MRSKKKWQGIGNVQLEETETVLHRRDGFDLLGNSKRPRSHRANNDQLLELLHGENASMRCLPIGSLPFMLAGILAGWNSETSMEQLRMRRAGHSSRLSNVTKKTSIKEEVTVRPPLLRSLTRCTTFKTLVVLAL
jgi:hypothetical protein